MTSKNIDVLNDIFYDPKEAASYSSATKLYKSLKNKGHSIPLKSIQKWLESQEVHTLHRPIKRKFPRNRVIVSGIDSQWDADLMDMTQLAKFNEGYKYVLLCIDILSKYAWVVPLKRKASKEMVVAFQKIFAQGRKAKTLRTDKGMEFRNRMLQKLFEEEGIHHFVTQNEVKANFAERCIKTLKAKIFKYFTKEQTYEYVDVLQDIVFSYNRTFHRTIGMTPLEVTKENEDEVWQKLYLPFKKVKPLKIEKKKLYKFRVGDTVRISHLKQAFDREYNTRWSEEIFKIRNRLSRENIPVYKLIDLKEENVRGTFYESELQKVHLSSNTLYKIEKIVKTRTRKRKKQHLVKWLFWPSKFDSWIEASDLEEYKR